MRKYILIFMTILMFSACGSSSSSDPSSTDENSNNTENVDNTNNIVESTGETNNDYVSSVSGDDTPNPTLARVPHNKSSIPMLGILVSYTNIKITSDESTWSTKLFGKNEHELNHYYQEVSNSKFEFSKAIENGGTPNDGIVSVSLNEYHPNTDIDSSSFASRVYPHLKEALEATDAVVDFSNYDSDANGHITPDELLLTFIIAGYEDSYEGLHVRNGIWAHQHCMESSSNIPTLDSVTLMGCQNEGNYALFGEKHNRSNPYDATIGVIAHELGHSAFKLPDLYNTAGKSGGIGYFGLMGAGTWTYKDYSDKPGNTPTHFSAWSKVYMNWVTPTQESGTTTLNETSSDSYNIIKIPISANQYYLLENRNNSGYDRGLFSLDGDFDGGMAIWHVDENKLSSTNFEINNVNTDTDNKALDLVEATTSTKYDNIDDDGSGGYEKILFYSPSVNAFGTKVTNISQRGSQMTLNIN